MKFDRKSAGKISQATKITLAKRPGDPRPPRLQPIPRGIPFALAILSGPVAQRTAVSTPTSVAGILQNFPDLDPDALPGTNRTFVAGDRITIYNPTAKIFNAAALVWVGYYCGAWMILSPTNCADVSDPVS